MRGHVKAYGWYQWMNSRVSAKRHYYPSMDIRGFKSARLTGSPDGSDNAVGLITVIDLIGPIVCEILVQGIQELTDLTMSGWAIEYDGEQYWYSYTYNGVNHFLFKRAPAVVFSPKYDNLSRPRTSSPGRNSPKIFSGRSNSRFHTNSPARANTLTAARTTPCRTSRFRSGPGLGLERVTCKSPSVEQTNGMMHDSLGNKGVQPNDPNSIHRQIHEQCNTELWKHMPIEMFSGEAAQQSMCIYNEDFFLGDFVQIQNESFGQQDIARVTSTSAHPRTRRGRLLPDVPVLVRHSEVETRHHMTERSSSSSPSAETGSTPRTTSIRISTGSFPTASSELRRAYQVVKGNGRTIIISPVVPGSRALARERRGAVLQPQPGSTDGDRYDAIFIRVNNTRDVRVAGIRKLSRGIRTRIPQSIQTADNYGSSSPLYACRGAQDICLRDHRSGGGLVLKCPVGSECHAAQADHSEQQVRFPECLQQRRI